MTRASAYIRSLALAGLVLAAVVTFGKQGQTTAQKSNPIIDKLSKLRSMPDDERATVTKQIALEIRKMPAGKAKAGLAQSLANLSTEGDFGFDTLQEVATTLAMAVQETPQPSQNGEPASAYLELAQLARFEHVKVNLSGPEYAAAVAKVQETERARAQADFTLNDIDGKSWTRSALKGKVVLVNFWATWCPPCRKEMPDLQTLYDRFKDRGLVVLAISDEDASKVNPFIAEHHYSYPVLLDPGRKVGTLYQVDGIPKSFVYDRSGKLVAQAIDMRTQGQFLKLLAAAGLKDRR